MFRTWGARVPIHEEPNTTSAVIGSLSGPTPVQVKCQVHGETVTAEGIANDGWCYLPDYDGYITNIYIDIPHYWLPEVPRCEFEGDVLAVMHVNIYGHVGNAGSHEEVRQLVNDLAHDIRLRDPDLVSLNEVCKSQAGGLENALGAEYELFASLAHWDAVRKPACGGEFGNAVLAKPSTMGTSDPFTKILPSTDSAVRPLVCMAFPMRQVLFCSAHLRAGRGNDAERARQVDVIHETLDGYNREGWTVVLAGDLNLSPRNNLLDSLYDKDSYGGGATGIYREADPDRNKQPTMDGGSAFDYIFVNRQAASISRPRITPVDYSDPHIYAATIHRTPLESSRSW